MQRRSRFRPLLENLEDRCCPSFTTSFSAGTLTLTGIPTAGPAVGQSLTIQRVGAAGTNYQVIDHGTSAISIGTFAITRDLHLNLTRYNTAIIINLNGGTFPGSIYLSLGQGNVNAPPIPPITIEGGTTPNPSQVNGSVYITGGSGQETVNIGQAPGDPTAPTSTEVTVAGSVNFTGSAQINSGNALNIGPGSTVSTGVNATQVASVTVGSFVSTAVATVSGNLTVNDNASSVASSGATVDLIGQVLGNVNFTGSNLNSNSLFFDNDSGTGGGVASVGGTVTANLGVSGGPFDDVDQAAGTSVGGNLNLSGGNGFALVSLDGIVGGSVGLNFGSGGTSIEESGSVGHGMTATLGNGSNSLTLMDGSFVGGNFAYTGGNAGNTVTLGGGTSGALAGTVTVRMGNGTNSFTQSVNYTIVGTTVSYYGGTGSDSVVISNPINGYNLIVNTGGTAVTTGAGAETDTVDLSAVTALNSAAITFGVLGTAGNAAGPGINKVWVQPTISPISFPLTLINFP